MNEELEEFPWGKPKKHFMPFNLPVKFRDM
jgi:hypothetical protein